MISADEALKLTLALARPPKGETVPIADAYGRVLMGSVKSRFTQPPFNSSAMDGYSMRSSDLPGVLQVVGVSAAGRPFDGNIPPGGAVRIFTGAEVPADCDWVVMQEDVSREGDTITITNYNPKNHIRPKGGDFWTGMEFDPGRRLSASDLGLLAAMNIPDVEVARRPRVAILPGGDELLPPGSKVGPGQILCSNDIAVAAIARQAGAETRILPIARDTAEDLRDALESARDCDLIVTIGGASVGDHDLIGTVTETMGMSRAFYRVAMRPGKPLVAGRLDETALLGLPGNPISSIICAKIFMQPLICKMQGLSSPPLLRKARLAVDLISEGPRRHYLRATLTEGEELPEIVPYDDQDSSKLGLMSQADCLLVREADDPPRKRGDIVSYIKLHEF